MKGRPPDEHIQARGKARRTSAGRAALWLLIWSVTLGLQWWSLWVAVNYLANGGGGNGCLGRQTPQTCVSIWGPWSFAVYAPEGALLVGLLAIAVNSRPRMYRATLLLAAVSLVVVWVAIAVTDGSVVGQMPWFPI